MKTIVIIPSRYASERLPAKPLAKIAGKTLIERVYRRTKLAEGIDEVYVATDHISIAEEVELHGGSVIMTSPECPSGTDRVAAAARALELDDDIVINVQGDEPLIAPEVITALATAMRDDPTIQVATPISRLKNPRDLTDPNVVKVVMDAKRNALYFSRQTIPYIRDLGDDEIDFWMNAFPYFKHIGVYAYRAEVLKQFVTLGVSRLEQAERLEQLRLLEAGIPIRCVRVDYESVAVDTPEDIKKVEDLIEVEGFRKTFVAGSSK